MLHPVEERVSRTKTVSSTVWGLMFAFVADAGTWYVTPDAAADGAGTSWDDPCAITDVAAKVAANDTVLVKAGDYAPDATVAFTKTVTVRGGLKGTDDTTLAETPYSVLDGQDTLSSIMTYSATLTIHNLEFTRGLEHGVCNSGYDKHLFAYDCRFIANGTQISSSYNNGAGRALQCSGQFVDCGGTCILSNCYVAGNAQVKSGSDWSGGGAVNIAGLTWAKVIDCTFVTNGVAWNYAAGSKSFGWGASASVINAIGTPISITGCKFLANRTASNQSYGTTYPDPMIYVGIVADTAYRARIAKFSWEIAISNCLFVGNMSMASGTGKMGHVATAPIFVNDTMSDLVTCRVDHCTFAYNNFDTTAGSAGLSLYAGTAIVRNSIFYGNRIAKSGTSGCDVKTTGSSGLIDIDYSLFAGTGSSNVYASAGTSVLVGDHVVTGDPLFVTTFPQIEPLLTDDGSLRYFANDFATAAALMAADLHVTNKTSRAIDAGDPSYPYDREPSPNGGRVNLGFYGGTPEACKTAVAQPEFVGDPELTFPYGTTQPRVRFTFGGGAGETYSATVTLEWSTNGTDYVVYRESKGYDFGDEFDHVLATAFRTGGTLSVRISIGAFGATTRTKTVTAALTNPCPASFGKGGGAFVLHVWPGATGDGSGRDWFNAMTEMAALTKSAALASAKEIWIAGTNVVTVTPDAIGFADKTVRGGFVGTENASGERRPGLLTVFDAGDLAVTAFVAACSGTVLFERLAFVRGGTRGASLSCLSANTAITLRDCRIEGNGTQRPLGWTSTGSLGLSASGNATSTLTLTNCTVVGNATLKNSGQEGDGAVVIGTFKRAYLLDCLFEANGVCWTNAVGTVAKINGCGEAALTVSAPATLVGCTFRANRVGAMWGGYSYRSAITYLTAQGNALTNCLFVANESVYKYGSDCGTTHAGSLLLGSSASTDIQNCTFAYNAMAQTAAGAAITVEGGTLKVRNSIFFENRQYPGTAKGADIWLNGSSGTLDVDYTLFAAIDEAHVCANDGCTVATNAASVLYAADPLLVSSQADFASLVSRSDNLGWTFPPTAEGLAQVRALDVHLRGRVGHLSAAGRVLTPRGKSPAIDAGDPSSAYSFEPDLDAAGGNGRRVNLGRYGNTREAALTEPRGTSVSAR